MSVKTVFWKFTPERAEKFLLHIKKALDKIVAEEWAKIPEIQTEQDKELKCMIQHRCAQRVRDYAHEKYPVHLHRGLIQFPPEGEQLDTPYIWNFAKWHQGAVLAAFEAGETIPTDVLAAYPFIKLMNYRKNKQQLPDVPADEIPLIEMSFAFDLENDDE